MNNKLQMTILQRKMLKMKLCTYTLSHSFLVLHKLLTSASVPDTLCNLSLVHSRLNPPSLEPLYVTSVTSSSQLVRRAGCMLLYQQEPELTHLCSFCICNRIVHYSLPALIYREFSQSTPLSAQLHTHCSLAANISIV